MQVGVVPTRQRMGDKAMQTIEVTENEAVRIERLRERAAKREYDRRCKIGFDADHAWQARSNPYAPFVWRGMIVVPHYGSNDDVSLHVWRGNEQVASIATVHHSYFTNRREAEALAKAE